VKRYAYDVSVSFRVEQDDMFCNGEVPDDEWSSDEGFEEVKNEVEDALGSYLDDQNHVLRVVFVEEA